MSHRTYDYIDQKIKELKEDTRRDLDMYRGEVTAKFNLLEKELKDLLTNISALDINQFEKVTKEITESNKEEMKVIKAINNGLIEKTQEIQNNLNKVINNINEFKIGD